MKHSGSNKATSLLFVLSAASCTEVQTTTTDLGGASNAGEAIDVIEQELALRPSIVKWPGGNISVCFESRSTSLERGWIEEALRDSWEAVADIDFTFLSSCPSSGNYVAVGWRLDPQNDWGVGGELLGGAGMKAGKNQVFFDYCTAVECLGSNRGDYEEAFKYVAIHEFGHVLGFMHEHQREDATPSCNVEQYGSDNGGVIPNAIELTTYYDPYSVMDYCKGWNGEVPSRFQLGVRFADRLSPGDSRGAQTAYGRRLPHWLTPGLTIPAW